MSFTNLIEVKTTTDSGKVRIWKVWSDAETIFTEYGIEGGAMQMTSKIATAKNIGKKNATTASEQASLEVERLAKKYREKMSGKLITDGISSGAAPVSPIGDIKPMLAANFNSRKTVTYPLFMQPKLDGVRVVAVIKDSVVTLFSRNGKRFPHFSLIKKKLLEIFKDDIILDGELYAHSLTDFDGKEISKDEKFQTLSKTFSVALKEPSFFENQLSYYIFDVINDDIQTERTEFLKTIPYNEYVKDVETRYVKNVEEGDELYEQYCEAGYEGAIYRSLAGRYETDKRSVNLLKRKPREDEEFEIVSFSDGKGKDKGTVIWRCKTADGIEFDVRPTGSVADRERYFKDGLKYIGKFLTVVYDSKLKSGKPRFPVGKSIRDE